MKYLEVKEHGNSISHFSSDSDDTRFFLCYGLVLFCVPWIPLQFLPFQLNSLLPYLLILVLHLWLLNKVLIYCIAMLLYLFTQIVCAVSIQAFHDFYIFLYICIFHFWSVAHGSCFD